VQYILSKEEYDNLIKAREKFGRVTPEQLQELCILAAEHVPVYRYWDKENGSPWGCILSKEGKNPGYCDECPSRKCCLYKNKQFSK
jgi:hypothetical protein